jgi:hypothetical protein
MHMHIHARWLKILTKITQIYEQIYSIFLVNFQIYPMCGVKINTIKSISHGFALFQSFLLNLVNWYILPAISN